MSFAKLAKTRRSIRRFQDKEISDKDLYDIIDCARMAPSGANIQPLKYIAIKSENLLDKVFECTAWAGYLKGGATPRPGERPKAYVIILRDGAIRDTECKYDAGAAAMNIIYSALDKGIGSCWIGSIKRELLAEILKIEKIYEITDIIALGYPAEQPIVEEFAGDIKYYKDENEVLHVPKRSLEDVIVKFHK